MALAKKIKMGRSIMLVLLVLAAGVLASSSLPAQADGTDPPTVLWERTWGGNYTDYFYGVAVDGNDRVYAVGCVDPVGLDNFNVSVVKYDADGGVIWSRTWGGSLADYGNGVAIDAANHVYVTGRTNSFGVEAFLLQYDSAGTLLWNVTFGGPLAWGASVATYGSAAIYVCGVNDSGVTDMFLAKFNASRDLEWIRWWDWGDADAALKVVVSAGHDVYLTGRFQNASTSSIDAFIMRVNATGHVTASREWYRGTSYIEEGRGLAIDANDDLYLVGYAEDPSTLDKHTLIVKYAANLTKIWNQTVNVTTWSVDDWGNAVAIHDGGIYITGHFNPSAYDAYLLEVDSNGDLQWVARWGGAEWDFGRAVAVDSAGGIYLVGYTGSPTYPDGLIIKYGHPPSTPIPGFTFLESAVLLGVLMLLIFTIKKAHRWSGVLRMQGT